MAFKNDLMRMLFVCFRVFLVRWDLSEPQAHGWVLIYTLTVSVTLQSQHFIYSFICAP